MRQMNASENSYTEPEIITTDDLKHRSYVTFYFKGERQREYNAKCINQLINPNRARTLDEKQTLLKKLQFEIHKALDSNSYPYLPALNKDNVTLKLPQKDTRVIRLMFDAIRIKLKSNLSKTYKRDLKSVYRQFRDYMFIAEKDGNINDISVARIELFLAQFGSSGTYYMNKRRNLSVILSLSAKLIDKPTNIVKQTSWRKQKSKLHVAYDRSQLRPLLGHIKVKYPNLYICCLITYGSWLRPHEEIRLLTKADFKKDNTEIHLTGGDNKGGKVRVVYIPEYIQAELNPILSKLRFNDNIFTRMRNPFNESYFNTQWSRAWEEMFRLGLVREHQTIYSFRHTAAVELYRKTKDVYLIQKLLGHSSITVTLKYLRSLGEVNTDELKNAAPDL